MREGVQQVQIRIPAAVHQALKSEAAKLERSVNWMINKILAEAVAAAAQSKGAKQ